MLQVGWFLGEPAVNLQFLNLTRYHFCNHQRFRWYLVKPRKGYFQGGNPHPQKDRRKKIGTGSEPSILGIPEMLGEGYVGGCHQLYLRGDDVGQSANGDASLDSRLSWHSHEAGIFLRIHFFWGGSNTNNQLRDLLWKSEGLTPLQCHVSPTRNRRPYEGTIHHQWSRKKWPYLLGGLALRGALRFAGIYGNCEGISPCHTDALFGCHMMIWGLPVKIYRENLPNSAVWEFAFGRAEGDDESLPKHMVIR